MQRLKCRSNSLRLFFVQYLYDAEARTYTYAESGIILVSPKIAHQIHLIGVPTLAKHKETSFFVCIFFGLFGQWIYS